VQLYRNLDRAVVNKYGIIRLTLYLHLLVFNFQVLCKVIAALLHFFFLAVFFLMLAYGIEIGVSVIYVFVTRSRLKWLLPCAWGT